MPESHGVATRGSGREKVLVTVDRERAVTRAFVSIASSLANGHDAAELLAQLTADCARLLDVASAGLLLADRKGTLQVLAASSETTRNLELFQLQSKEGPCLECYRLGQPISVADLSADRQRWPRFAAAALDAGFASVHAVPMRLQNHMLGGLGLFGTEVGALNEEDLSLGQALADVASVSLVQERADADSKSVTDQLQTALDSRVIIEQAKGLLGQLGSLDMDQAFAVLRRFSRDNNRRLADVARALVARDLSGQQLLDHADLATAGARQRQARQR
jgi:transcriptional regulator with GAF, ATPase, and Fis domain